MTSSPRWKKSVTSLLIAAALFALATPASANDAAPEVAETPAPDRPEQRPLRIGKGTVITTGLVIFGASYVPNVALGAPSIVGAFGRIAMILTLDVGCVDRDNFFCQKRYGAGELLLPVVGPLLFAVNHPPDPLLNPNGRPLDGFAEGMLYASAAVQLVGLGTLVVGLAMNDAHVDPPSRPRSGRASSFFVTPAAAPNTIGISAGFASF
jgi:hypothetical protein